MIDRPDSGGRLRRRREQEASDPVVLPFLLTAEDVGRGIKREIFDDDDDDGWFFFNRVR